MTTHSTQTVDKYDLSGFLQKANPPDVERSKTLSLAGLSIKVMHRITALGEFISPIIPLPRILQGNTEASAIKSFSVIDGDFQTAYTGAIDWADRAAHVSQIADAAATALNMEPSLVAEDVGCCYELAQQCVEIAREFPKDADHEGEIEDHTVLEGRYTVDVSALMDHDQSSAPRGGVYTVKHEHDNGQPYEVDVRVSLVMVLSPTMTDGRWLAVYDVEEA